MSAQASKTKNAAILLFVAAALTLVGVFTKTWFSMRHDSGGIGILGAQSCYDGHCETQMWMSIRRAPGDVQLFSFLGLIGGALAAAFAIHAGVMLLRGEAQRAKAQAIVVLAGIAAVASAIFFLRLNLGEIGHRLSVSWGFFACIAGLIGLFVGANRARGVVQPVATTAPMGYGAQPPMGYGAQPPMIQPHPGMPPQPMMQPGQPGAPMHPYPLALQKGMTRYYGHLFLAPGRLFFVCTQQGGAWLAAVGAGLGGALGAVLANAALTPEMGGAPIVVDSEVLVRAVHQHPGSMILEPHQIGVIKQTLFWRLMKVDGKTIGLPRGLGRELKPAIAAWARAHNVAVKGFA